MALKAITLRLTEDLHDRIRYGAYLRRTSVTETIRQILDEHLPEEVPASV